MFLKKIKKDEKYIIDNNIHEHLRANGISVLFLLNILNWLKFLLLPLEFLLESELNTVFNPSSKVIILATEPID